MQSRTKKDGKIPNKKEKRTQSALQYLILHDRSPAAEVRLYLAICVSVEPQGIFPVPSSGGNSGSICPQCTGYGVWRMAYGRFDRGAL